MTVTDTPLPGVKVVHPVVYHDDRGFFLETYHQRRYAEHGMHAVFVQDNHSRSVRGTLRGLHLQVTALQAKLVHVVVGEILDVAVDLRVGSPTFGRYHAVRLTASDASQVYLPEGFGHGFAVLSEVAEVEYKCSAPYDRDDEVVVRFDDPAIGVAWPVTAPILSPRDRVAPLLKDVMHRLPRI